MNTPSLPERTALVVGGSRGIGAAIARRLANDGFGVALTYATRPDKATEVVAAIQAGGGQALAIAGDSSDPQALRQAIDHAAAWRGGLDVLVVNAGLYRPTPLASFELDTLDQLLAVNVRGVVLAVQAASAHLRDGGRIILIGSNTAIRTGIPGSSVYAMTKAAVAALARELALELAPRRITINTVQPGPTATDITEGAEAMLASRLPLAPIAQPEEIAELASYLASPASRYMTGTSLTIDGGFIL